MEENTRNCPKCSKEINYKSKYSMINAEKNKSECGSCRLSGSKNPMHGRSGSKNPFYGKNHSEEFKKKIGKINKGNKKFKTKKFKDKISLYTKGDKNPMYGKSFYDVWVEKYGKEEADKKLNALKEKQSKLNSGKNNNMYGKPSPQGSGNGWSGWYKGWYFRSLSELSFMINYIERFNMKWTSAEKQELKIKYGKRNYFADFLINEKYLIECKPKKLFNTKIVQRKKKSAELFCIEKGIKYKMIDPIKLSKDEIYKLYKNGDIKLIEKYEKKMKNYE